MTHSISSFLLIPMLILSALSLLQIVTLVCSLTNSETFIDGLSIMFRLLRSKRRGPSYQGHLSAWLLLTQLVMWFGLAGYSIFFYLVFKT